MSADAEFLRRVYLDTIGTLPRPDETRSFLADASTDKRDRLIDRLLSSSEFVDYWTYRWSDVLLLSSRRLQSDAVKSFYGWIRSHVARNTPWDEVARQVVTARAAVGLNGGASQGVPVLARIVI